jgi:uncharacterized protein YciI
MFLLITRYTRPAEEVDRHLEGHVAWIGRNADRVLFTARRVPLTGGVILARGESIDQMRAMIAEDPFVTAGVAEYEIIELDPRRAAPGLEGLLEP